MSIGKALVMIVVLGLITAGVLQYFGIYHFTDTAPVASGPPSKSDPYDTAEIDFGAFKYDVAVNEYKKAIEDDPKSDKFANAMYRIGVCYDNLKGKEQDAEDAFKAFVDKFPNDPMARKASERIEYLHGITNK